MSIPLKLSVHELVDFLLRKGDIDSRVYNTETMREGSRLHSLHQAKQSEEYISEFSLKYTFNLRGYEVSLFGRADGLTNNKDDSITIDEIKSTNIEINDYKNAQLEWHLGQAKCYALMAVHFFKKERAIVQITYLSQTSNKSDIVKVGCTKEELEEYVFNLLNEYLDFYEIINKHQELRKSSAKTLDFPYLSKRRGQNEMILAVDKIVNEGGQLLIEAPTGIGKTVSTLYPSLKSFEFGENNKVFYLTAKTSGQIMAYESLQVMKEKGLEIKEVVLGAKDKVCLNLGNVRACNPDQCPYAKDYFSKIKNVVFEMFQNEPSFSKEVVKSYALKHEICPFELQLDLSTFSDVIIGDYNYFFDPQVYLQRHFEKESDDTVVLIDEAHNLVDRAQNMYSASINTYEFELLEKQFKDLHDVPKFKTRIKALKREFKKINEMLNLHEEVIFKALPESLYKEIEKFVGEARKMLKDKPEYGFKDTFIPFFFNANRFIKIYDLFGDNYCGYFLKEFRKSFKINLLCLDASSFLSECYSRVKGVVLFSATLTPIEYYGDVLGLTKPLNHLILPSPFSNKQLLTLINPTISTKRDDREFTYNDVANNIRALVKHKMGNYFIFVPSYEYLTILPPLLKNLHANIYIQEKDMSEEERLEFLERFPVNPRESNIGLVVMGGVFSEGIDLIEDRLIGVVIVGVGMPSVNFERRVMQNYYSSIGLDGFKYALTIPGINRVRQAVGRLIRSEFDRGVALFIEARYANYQYRHIFKGMLGNYEYVSDEEQIDFFLDSFYHSKY